MAGARRATAVLSSLFLVGLAGLIPVLVALSGGGERGTYSVTALNDGEHCFSTGVFVPDRPGPARPASMEGECSAMGGRVAALGLWSGSEVYPASPARLTRQAVSPALLTTLGLAILGDGGSS